MDMKKALLRKLAFLVCGMVLLGMMGCAASPQLSQVSQARKYLKYNFHYYSRGRDNYMVASIVNYVNCPNHGFLPYNTWFFALQYRSESWQVSEGF
jgi:hypothetical protein